MTAVVWLTITFHYSVTSSGYAANGIGSSLEFNSGKLKIKFDQSKGHSQFLMSEMKTANPRIPSPFDTAGILQDFVLTPTLPLKIHVDQIFAQDRGGRMST